MEKNNYSAEKELLKTIEEGSGFPGKKGGASYLNSGELKSRSLFFIHNLGSNFIFPGFAKIKNKFILPQGGFDFTAVQSILKLSVGLVMLFYLLTLARGVYRLDQIPVFDVSAERAVREETQRIGNLLKSLAFYRPVLLERNIFIPKTEEERPAKATEISELRKMVNSLKVVGISWSDDSDEYFAMIEDAEKDITYFLREGDRILNLTVNQILKDRVIFYYQDEEIILQ